MYKKLHLERFERIYYNGTYLSTVCTRFNNSIRDYCKIFGISPDCITKRIRYKLICDDDLPF